MIFYRKKRLVKHLKSEQDRLTQISQGQSVGTYQRAYLEGKLDVLKDILNYINYEL